jgi:hypothetical protein
MTKISIGELRKQAKAMTDEELAAYAAEQTALVLQSDGSARGLADFRLRIARGEQIQRHNPWRNE